MARVKKGEAASRQQMPEYQPLPRGMWHMLGAVMMMIPVFALIVSFLSSVLEVKYEVESLIYFDVAALVIFSLLLSIPTILIVFGYAGAHKFLLSLNCVQAAILTAAVPYSVVFDTYTKAGIWAIGLGCALLARKLYLSAKFAEYRNYARAVWAAHRGKSNQDS